MIIRVFRPTIHPGKESEFESFLRDEAIPLVSRQSVLTHAAALVSGGDPDHVKWTVPVYSRPLHPDCTDASAYSLGAGGLLVSATCEIKACR